MEANRKNINAAFAKMQQEAKQLGAVRSFDDILSVKWRGQTFAESEKKARSNLGYQFRKHMGLSQGVPIRLTGKMTVC